MQIGKVLGTIWGSKKVTNSEGLKFLRVALLEYPNQLKSNNLNDLRPNGQEVTIQDSLGAEVGQYVLIGDSSRIRDLLLESEQAIKTMNLAILDDGEIHDLG